MIVNDLKRSILQYALSGKICKQNNNDTSVDEMILSIKRQKANIKSRLNRFEDTKSQDIPFSIPTTWKWMELKDISLDIYAGGDKPKHFSKEKTSEYSIPVIANGETNDGIIGYTDQATEKEPALTVAGRGTIGFSKYRTFPFTPIVRLIVIKLPNEVDYQYLQKVFEFLIEGGVGTSVKQLTVPMIVNKYVPIPPIEEQKRIVKKIDELFDELDNIKLVEDKLNRLKSQISIDLKYSILDSAIKGDLIETNSSYQSCIDNNYKNPPFQIPNNWNWIKIDDVLEIQTGLGFKKTDQCNSSEGEIRVLRGGNINNNYEYELKDDDVYVKGIDKYTKLKCGDILTPSVTSMEQMGKVAYIDKDLEKITAGGFVYIIRSKNHDILYPKYALYFISSKFHKEMCKPNIHKSGQAFYNLKKSGLIEQPIPIPPIEEQQRIVDKIEQLLPLCNDIENLINS